MVGVAEVLLGAEMIDLDELERLILASKAANAEYKKLGIDTWHTAMNDRQKVIEAFDDATCLRLVRAVKCAINYSYIGEEVLKILEATGGD